MESTSSPLSGALCQCSASDPIARKYSLPMNLVVQVAATFVDTGTLSPTVLWEVI